MLKTQFGGPNGVNVITHSYCMGSLGYIKAVSDLMTLQFVWSVGDNRNVSLVCRCYLVSCNVRKLGSL